MSEKTLDPIEIEKWLKIEIQSVHLIGQIPLSAEQSDYIVEYIKKELSGKFSENIDYTIKNTPAILAWYLVWKGIQNYDEGTYWVAITKELGSLDPNQQGKLGQFFRDFISANKLLLFDVPRARRNITPILFHGIIPKEMIGEFFTQLINPLYKRELINPLDESEIAHWLDSRRQEYKKTQQISVSEAKINEYENRIRAEEEKLALLKGRLRELDSRLKHEDDIRKSFEKIGPLYENYKSNLDSINELKNTISTEPRNGLEQYREEVLDSIIKSINSKIDDSNNHVRKDARKVASFIYNANLHGKMVLNPDQIEKITKIYNSFEK